MKLGRHYSRKDVAAFSKALRVLYAAESPATVQTALDLQRSHRPASNDADGNLEELLAFDRKLLDRARETVRRRSISKTVRPPESNDALKLLEAGLTPREIEVLSWLRRGKSDAQIAILLGCAVKTVGKHVENLLSKLGAETRLGAAHMAAEWLRERE